MRRKYLLLEPTQGVPAKYIETFLGTFCSNPHEPLRNFFPKDPRGFYDADAPPIVLRVEDATIFASKTEDDSVKGDLLNLLSVGKERAHIQEAEIKAQKLRIFILPQEPTVFRNIRDDDTLGRTLKTELKENHGYLYLVVGFVTMCNAVFCSGTAKSISQEAEANISKAVEAAAAANAIPLKLGDIKIQVHESTGDVHHWTARYEEETIVAIKYELVARRRDLRRLLMSKTLTLEDITSIPGGLMFGKDEDADVDEKTKYWKNLLETGQEPEDPDCVDISPATNIPDLEGDPLLAV